MAQINMVAQMRNTAQSLSTAADLLEGLAGQNGKHVVVRRKRLTPGQKKALRMAHAARRRQAKLARKGN